MLFPFPKLSGLKIDDTALYFPGGKDKDVHIFCNTFTLVFKFYPVLKSAICVLCISLQFTLFQLSAANTDATPLHDVKNCENVSNS